MQEYIQELGSLLVQLGDGDSPNFQLEQRLQQVTIESSQLMGIIKSLNVEVYKAVLKNGVGPPLADGQEHLGNQWYLSLEVSAAACKSSTSRANITQMSRVSMYVECAAG